MMVSPFTDDVIDRLMGIFWLTPALLLCAVALSYGMRVLRPTVNDAAGERLASRDQRGVPAMDADTQTSLALAEVRLRAEYDEWLETESLRLQIECAAHPAEGCHSEALAQVERIQKDNAARIAALHQGEDAGTLNGEGIAALKEQWDSLRRPYESPPPAEA